MATQLVCDGCSIPLYRLGESTEANGGVTPSTGRELVISGQRANHMGGGSPIPNGTFHWCETCAKTAFWAVRDVRGLRG